MKNYIVFLFLCCFSMVAVNAQEGWTLRGSVVDQVSGEPVPFATVALYPLPDGGPAAADPAQAPADSMGVMLAGTVASLEGGFVLSVERQPGSIEKMSCWLVVSSIGYEKKGLVVSATADTMDLGSVGLTPDGTMLEAVMIEAKTPIVEQKMDKLVVNVAQSALAQGNNALEVLRKAPGVSVDKDGNVLLNGQSVSVWIDGRPSQLDGKSLENLLRGTPGSSIDKIEVMANPSAKYDAEGQGGIINIKTRRTLMSGLNGSLSGNLGGMGFGRELELLSRQQNFFVDQDISGNISYRTDKTNTFLQLWEQTSEMGVDLHSDMQAQLPGIASMRQQASSYNTLFSRSLMMKVGNDWMVDSANTIGVIFTMPVNYVSQWADTNANRTMMYMNDAASQDLLSYARTGYDTRQYMANMNYTHIFDEARASEITANLDYARVNASQSNTIESYITNLLAPAGTGYSEDAIGINSHSVIDIYSAKADYQSVVWGRYMMETGAKWATSVTNNELTLRSSATGTTPVVTPFRYNENVGALYATLAGQFKGGFSAKAGLRGEYTYAFNSDNTVKQNYFDLFPTLYAGYNTPDMKKRLSLSYTRRIQRPNFMQLNPFQNYVDAHTSNMGNPDLKPCYSDNLSLTVGLGYFVTLSANWINSRDVISVIPKLNPATGDQIMYMDNFGRNRMLGGGVTLTELPLGKMVRLMMNMGAYDFFSQSPETESLVAGQPGSGEPYEVHSFYGSAYASLSVLPGKDWRIEFDGWLSTPVTSGYIRADWNQSYNLAVKKTTKDNRLTFSLGITDIFRTMNNSFVILAGDGVETEYNQRYLVQKVKLGLQWNFGTAQKPLRKRDVGTLDEASRTGVSTGVK